MQKTESGKPRILIVGGVAGGASCAARARRLSENAEIIIFERGPFVSFASCGLPYYVGDVIREEKNLLVATPELFKRRFNVEVKLRNEVQSIDRSQKVVQVKKLETGEVRPERYDALVLSPGSSTKIPAIPGIDLPGIFTLRTIQDSNRIKNWMAHKRVKRAVVVGGGFIGLETVENLFNLGLKVTVVEMLPQVMPNFDPEIIDRLQEFLTSKGVELHLGDAVRQFSQSSSRSGIKVLTRSGTSLECDMMLLAGNSEVTLEQAGHKSEIRRYQ
jgi:NADPH-dependent 2,4-dienoyl-CoA reductase/sulfur reductase-like enzyme